MIRIEFFTIISISARWVHKCRFEIKVWEICDIYGKPWSQEMNISQYVRSLKFLFFLVKLMIDRKIKYSTLIQREYEFKKFWNSITNASLTHRSGETAQTFFTIKTRIKLYFYSRKWRIFLKFKLLRFFIRNNWIPFKLNTMKLIKFDHFKTCDFYIILSRKKFWWRNNDFLWISQLL